MKHALCIGSAVLCAVVSIVTCGIQPAGASALSQGSVELGISMPLNSPLLGYFVADNLEVTGAFYYLTGSADSGGTSVDLSGSGLNLAGRYFFSQAGSSPVIPFADVTVQRLSFDMGPSSTTITRFLIGGGVKYFVTDNFALEASLGYNIAKLKTGAGGVSTTGDVSGFQLGAGMTVFIH